MRIYGPKLLFDFHVLSLYFWVTGRDDKFPWRIWRGRRGNALYFNFGPLTFNVAWRVYARYR